jgi:predicted O-methyltransferase YrrM
MRRFIIKYLLVSIRNRIDKITFSIRFSRLLIPHIRKEAYLDMWVVRPMNGQRNRLRTSILLLEILKPEFVIESGSYLGTTTQYLAGFSSKKTFSIEINKEFAEVASSRLKSDIEQKRVEIVDGNSAQQMPLILRDINPRTSRIFAYLDAHWLEQIPLFEELQALLDWGGDFIAVIDDFFIPDDQGYGYDQYRNHRVDISHVPSSEKISVWVPSESSETESGARRGTGYIVSSNLTKLIEKDSVNLQIKPY